MYAEISAPPVRQQLITFETMFERPPEDRARAKLVRNFFKEALTHLGRGMPEEILAGPPLERAWPDPSGWAGPPGSLWGKAVVHAYTEGADRRSTSKFSMAALRRLTTRLGEPITTSARLLLCRLDEQGKPFMMARPHLEICYEKVLDDWIRLSVTFDTVDLFDQDFIRSLRRFQNYAVDGFNPAFGILDYKWRHTQLEEDLGSIDEDNIPFMRECLRGYGWVTIVPQEIVDRFPGAAGFAGTAAFAQVDDLPGGGVRLQATHRFADYSDEDAERVRGVLQPYLLTRESALAHAVKAN